MREIPAHVKTLLQKRQMIGPDRPNHRVHVVDKSAEAEMEGEFVPFWQDETPKEEWALTSYRPWKIVQGYTVGEEEHTQQRISNWVPTNDGRFVSAMVRNIGGTNRIVWAYCNTEDEFLSNNYPGTEIVVDENFTVHSGAAEASLTRFWEDDKYKIMLILRDFAPSQAVNYPNLIATNIDCYVSPSGNGYEMVGEDKVSDLYYRSRVATNDIAEDYPEGTTFHDQRQRRGIVNELYIDDDGAFVLSIALPQWRGWPQYGVFYMSRRAEAIYRSDTKGYSWDRVHSNVSIWGVYTDGMCKPVKVKGILYVGYQHGVRQGLLTSSTGGQSWTNRGLMPSKAYDAVNRAINDSYWYDEEEDVLYSHCAGAYGGCGIWTLENPTVERMFEVRDPAQEISGGALNYSMWERLMYTHANNNITSRLYTTPQDRLCVQWSTGSAWSETWGTTSGAMTVIIGFTEPEPPKIPLRAKRINISRSRTSASDLGVVFDNKKGRLTPEKSDSEYPMLLWMNNEIQIEQGYGQNLARTFTGLIDSPRPRHSPGNAEIEVAARDFYKLALDQTITTEEGYHTVIFKDVALENQFRQLALMAGFEADKIITEPTGIKATKEYSQEAYADAFQVLCEEAFFEAFCDDYGRLYYLRQQERGQELDPKHIFTEGVDIVRLDYDLDDEDLYYKVIVYGRTDPEEGEEAEVISAEADYAPRDYYQVLEQKVMQIHTDAATVEACQEIADRAVQLMLSKPRHVDFAAIGIPWLQVGDRIQVIETTSGISEIYRIDDMDITQEPDSLLMTIGCHHYGYMPAPEE